MTRASSGASREVWPIYKFAPDGSREYLFYGSTVDWAGKFLLAWNRANRGWSNGAYYAAPMDLPAGERTNTYRDWTVSWDYGYYEAVHDSYDAEWLGEEDGWQDNGMRLFDAFFHEMVKNIDQHDASKPMSLTARLPA